MCSGNRLTLDFSARNVDYGYDAASRLTTVSNPLVTAGVPVAYQYSADSQIAAGCLDANASGVCDTGETTTTYPRDTAGRLSELLNAAGAGTLSDFVYTLDPLGNRTDAVETLALPGQAGLPSPHIYADAAPQLSGSTLADVSAQDTPLLQPLLDAIDAAWASGAIHGQGLYNDLRQKVEGAQKAIDRGQCDTALNNLQAFLNDVDAQSGKGIDPSTAEQLSTLATAAINTLDCVPTATPSSTPEPSSTPTATPTASDTPTPTATSTATATDTPTPTVTVTPSATETPTATNTGTVTPTKTPTATKTPTLTLTPTLTPTPKSQGGKQPGPSGKSAPLGPNVLLSGSTTYRWHYQYDKLQRLTYACSDWNGTACVGSVFNYAYDGAGNLLSFDKWNGSAVETVHYKYNGANQIQCVDANNNNQCGDIGDIAYTYDAYGNLTNDGSSTYSYDAENRLISVVKGGVTTSYTYNGDGNRLSQTVGTTTTTYVIDTATPLTMVLSETTGTNTTYYWQGLDTLGQSDGATAKYFEYDGLGSVRQLTDSSGTVQLAQTFDPYGNGFSKAGTATSNLGYTGEQTDSNGFVFLRARYYQPGMGQFFQADPSRQENDPYQYAGGDPVLFADPTGTICLLPKPLSETGIHFNLSYGCQYPVSKPPTSSNGGFSTIIKSSEVDTLPEIPPFVEAPPVEAPPEFVVPPGPLFGDVDVVVGTGIGGASTLTCVGSGAAVVGLTANPGCPMDTVYYGSCFPAHRPDVEYVQELIDKAHPMVFPVGDAASARLNGEQEEKDKGWDIVFRNPGVGEHPLALSVGFVPKEPNNMTRGIDYHVTHGSTVGTRFISLTRSIDVAKQWQQPAIPIYMINLKEVHGIVYDFTVPSIRDQYLSSFIAKNIATKSQEVVIEGWIPPEAIKGTIDFMGPITWFH